MAQKFNKVTTYSNFIKNLLATTYLPLVRSVREGDYICKDRLYIFRCEVIKCTKSGYIGAAEFLNNTPIAYWERLTEYHFGEKDGKLSTCFVSNAEGYDYKTHERLGQYLRNLRDMYGLNLMPLYNCFSNQFLDNHKIKDGKVIRTSYNKNTKIYKIPIRFNQDYTVCIENVGVTTFAPAFLRYNNLLKQNNTMYGNGIDITNQYISLHAGDKIRSYSGLSFGEPVKIRFDNKPEIKKYNIYKFPKENPGYVVTEDEDPVEGKLYYIKNKYDKFINVDTSNGFEKYTDVRVGDVFEDNIVYYEKINDEYIETEDETPQQGKQYYIKSSIVYYEEAEAIKIDNTVIAQYEITDKNCADFDEVEDHLYLLIQVPKAFNQNIVVLEGDYTALESQKIVDYTVMDRLPDFLYDEFYTHDLNLMTCTSTEPRPFSPALVEFLLWNAISVLDTINNDFDRLSLQMFSKYVPNTNDIANKYPNFWVPRYRQIISDYINNNSKNVIQDNLGYVTKEIEKYIYKDVV